MTYDELLDCEKAQKRVLIGGHKYTVTEVQSQLHQCGKVSLQCTFRRNSTEISVLLEAANYAGIKLPFPCELAP